MTDNIPQASSSQNNISSFGIYLKETREAKGLARKDVAAQLRLQERIIATLEEEPSENALPTVFLRGYLRSYGRLLNIPETEIQKATASLRVKDTPIENMVTKETNPITSMHYSMQTVTYLIIFTLLGLAGIWWYTHDNTPEPTLPIPISMQQSLPTLEQASSQTPTIPTAAPAATSPQPATPSLKANTPSTPIADNTDNQDNQDNEDSSTTEDDNEN